MFMRPRGIAHVKDALLCLEKHFNVVEETDERYFDMLCILNSELFVEMINDIKLQKDVTGLYLVEVRGNSGLPEEND